MENYRLSQLRLLEAESIDIIREVASSVERPVLLYSVGKDSSVLVHLAQKAFHPAPLPFPLLHVDTTLKFKEMYEFRDRFVRSIGAELRVHGSSEVAGTRINPWALGTVKCCSIFKTQALLGAMKEGKYDAAFGGARRDEEKSRAKERVFSFRDEFGQWDPQNQRPELWGLYNTLVNKGESLRIFPLSNWTELDIWQYIHLEKIPVVPMYFAKERDMIVREGRLIPMDGPIPLKDGERPEKVMCRFRTLGCYPCTGAVRSTAATIPAIIEELMSVRDSERITRLIDHDQDASMEQKKREGYF
ncbi:MAG: sulfate adenylyltransferase subunit CysD [Candidatus Omnitrophica bacterium]|nr:sulfate adenylyltransferase subunit CysD [Candidatus Omnitrophota bacterium]